MINHIFTHLTAPVQILILTLFAWKLVDIIAYAVKKHKENKNK